MLTRKCIIFSRETACLATADVLEPRTCQPISKCVSNCESLSRNCLDKVDLYKSMLTQGQLGMNMLPPNCDEDGYYEPIQCDQGGLCRCVDKDFGE
mgnify:CR=1 FL=1